MTRIRSFRPNSGWGSIETNTIGKTHPTVKLKSSKAYFFNCERHLSGLFNNYLENIILVELMWRVDQVRSRWHSSFEFSFIYDITFDSTYKPFFRKRLSYSILQATLWRIWCCYQAYWSFMGRNPIVGSLWNLFVFDLNFSPHWKKPTIKQNWREELIQVAWNIIHCPLII